MPAFPPDGAPFHRRRPSSRAVSPAGTRSRSRASRLTPPSRLLAAVVAGGRPGTVREGGRFRPAPLTFLPPQPREDPAQVVAALREEGWLVPACCQRRLSARPASMHASLDPVVEQPTAVTGSGAFHSCASIRMHRCSTSAVRGYSSLSIMFLSNDSAISRSACGSAQVVTNVARFSRALPSSISSSCTTWPTVAARWACSDRRPQAGAEHSTRSGAPVAAGPVSGSRVVRRAD